MLFEFKIYDKELIKINKQYIINTDKYNKCKFYFDEYTWKNEEIFATFINQSGYSQNVILGKWAETLSCTIPARIMDGKYFKVFLHSKTLFKTNTLKVDTRKRNCQIKEKRTDAINYVLDKLNTKIDNIIFEDNQLKCYSEEVLVDTVYIDNIDEAMVKNIVDNCLDTFKIDIEEQLEQYITDDDLDYLIVSL